VERGNFRGISWENGGALVAEKYEFAYAGDLEVLADI
jgi:hypothetical protein